LLMSLRTAACIAVHESLSDNTRPRKRPFTPKVVDGNPRITDRFALDPNG